MNQICVLFFESNNLFGIDIFNAPDFNELLLRYLFNLLVTFILARVLYYSVSKRKDYLFSYFLFGSVVFLLCFMLGNVKLQLGFALGLFALFGILRYRTATIPVKEMTYLFIIIGTSVINALFSKEVTWTEVILANFIIVFLTYLLEKIFLLKHESSKLILIEKIELIKQENYNNLLEDLTKRTGLNIHRVEIGKIDFLRDVAEVTIFFYENKFFSNPPTNETNSRSF